jgi:hypothetical protein
VIPEIVKKTAINRPAQRCSSPRDFLMEPGKISILRF